MVTVACLCPPRADGTPRHPDGDEIQLRERLDFRSATTIRNAVGFARADDPDLSPGEILAILTEHYVLFGVESWTLVQVDEKGKTAPLPVTKPNLRAILLVNDEAATVVGDAADEAYREQILGPLVRRASMSSAPGPTDDSTSPSKDSPSSNPTPSSPSSTSTTPTDATGTITSLPVGDSRSSPRASRRSGTAA